MGVPKKMDAQEEILRLMVIQLRRTAKNQAEVIVELDKAGFGPARIGELVGTAPNTVGVTLNQAKKRAARADVRGHES